MLWLIIIIIIIEMLCLYDYIYAKMEKVNMEKKIYFQMYHTRTVFIKLKWAFK